LIKINAMRSTNYGSGRNLPAFLRLRSLRVGATHARATAAADARVSAKSRTRPEYPETKMDKWFSRH
jgi:hypothetical protein